MQPSCFCEQFSSWAVYSLVFPHYCPFSDANMFCALLYLCIILSESCCLPLSNSKLNKLDTNSSLFWQILIPLFVQSFVHRTRTQTDEWTWPWPRPLLRLKVKGDHGTVSASAALTLDACAIFTRDGTRSPSSTRSTALPYCICILLYYYIVNTCNLSTYLLLLTRT